MQVRTREAVQCLLGEDGWLEVELADAELAGEGQVREVTVSTTNVLQKPPHTHTGFRY